MRQVFMVAVAVLLTVGALLWSLEGETVSISVRSTQLRANPGHLAQVVGQLSYADQVEVLEVGQDFYRVSSPEGQGWIHRSAVSEDEIVLEASGEDVERSADDREVALAGRGFNEEVERRYGSEQGLSFDGVDRMESRRREGEAIRAFIEGGGLRLPGEE